MYARSHQSFGGEARSLPRQGPAGRCHDASKSIRQPLKMEAADSAAGERPVDGEEKNTEGSEGAGEERAAGPPSPAKEASGEGPAEAASGKAVSSDAKSEASASLEGGDGGAFRRESSSSLNLNLNLNEASPKASAVEEDRGLRPSPSSLSPSMAAQSQSAVAASEPLKTGASGRKHRSSVSFASPDGPSRDDNEAGALRRELGVASARTHGGNAAKAEASASAGNVSGGGLWQRVLQEARLKSSLPRKSFVVLLGRFLETWAAGALHRGVKGVWV